MSITRLNRTVFRLSGDNVRSWLDGIVTCAMPEPISFGALLTPQGKNIADFFLIDEDASSLLLDTPRKFADDLEKRLKMFRLREPITIERTNINSYAVFGDQADVSPFGHDDPRHPTLGKRMIILTDAKPTASLNEYNAHRLSLGVVDSMFDFESAKVFPADVNMDLMNGVDYQKGCFVGQEVTSRMKRMTTAKKRARGFICDGGAKAGDDIKAGGRVIGTVMSAQDTMGMAMIRLDRWKAATEGAKLGGADVQIMGASDGSE